MAEPTAAEMRASGCVASAGVFAFPLLVWGFVARFELGVADAVFLAAALGVLPFLAVAQVALARTPEVDRRDVYAGTASMLVILGTGALLLGWDVPGVRGMGLAPPAPAAFALWTGALVLFAVVLQGASLLLQRAIGWQEPPLLEQVLPRTRGEKAAFAGVSVAAALGEEISFRGYAIPLLAPVLGGSWAAAAFTSAVFGLLHAYQGGPGILRTGLFGAGLAASFVLSGSLWPAIAAHLVTDLVVGLWLGRRLLAWGEGATHPPPPPV